MEVLSITGSRSLSEWSSFLSVLNTNKEKDNTPLLRKSGTPGRLIDHLEKQFIDRTPQVHLNAWYTVQKVKRKPVLPGQLSMQFA